jgi:hypothetical protein
MRETAKAAGIVFLLCLSAYGQLPKLLFPLNSFGGFGDFNVAPSHNEWDLNRCSPAAGSPSVGGVNTPCAAFARASLGGYLELKPLNWSIFRRLYVFGSPRFFFGDNVPQTRYTASLDPIGLDKTFGLIYDLPRNFQMRLTQHSKMDWLGKYGGNLGAADLGGDGPFGQNLNIGVRYNFGTFTRQRHE